MPPKGGKKAKKVMAMKPLILLRMRIEQKGKGPI